MSSINYNSQNIQTASCYAAIAINNAWKSTSSCLSNEYIKYNDFNRE